MPVPLLGNFFQSTNASTMTNVATSAVLASTSGFVVPGTGQYGIARVDDVNAAGYNQITGPFEILTFTGNNTGTNTLSGFTRAQEGTSAHAFAAGSVWSQVFTKGAIGQAFPQQFANQAPSSGTSITQVIPSSWRHIDVILSVAITATNAFVTMQLNGDAGGHYYWASAGEGSDSTRAGNGGAAVTSATVGFIGTSTAQTWDGRIRLNDTQQTARRIGWTFEGTYGNIGAPNVVDLHGGGEWFPSALAALTSITIGVNTGTITSSSFSFYGWP